MTGAVSDLIRSRSLGDGMASKESTAKGPKKDRIEKAQGKKSGSQSEMISVQKKVIVDSTDCAARSYLSQMNIPTNDSLSKRNRIVWAEVGSSVWFMIRDINNMS